MFQKKISVKNPGLIVAVSDNSGSTADTFPGTTDPVFLWITRFVGIILMELLARCTAVLGTQAHIKLRYYISQIIYGSQPQQRGDSIQDIETTVKQYQEAGNSLGLDGSSGGTDTKAAFEMVHALLTKAVAEERFRDSFPPMVFHLTDGLSHTDASAVAEQIKQLTTNDGNVLIVNAFIGTQTNLSYKGPEDFPGYTTEQEAGSSEDNIRLFNMSSVMPETIFRNLVDDGIFPNLRPDARLFFDVRTKEMLKHVIQVVGSIGSRADRTER